MAERLFGSRTEIAKILGCSPRTVDRGIDQGIIPAVRINSLVRIPVRAFCAAVGIDLETVIAELSKHDAAGSPPLPAVHDGGAAA